MGGGNRMEIIPRNRWICYEDKTNGSGDVANMFKTPGLVLSVTYVHTQKTQEQRYGQRIIKATLFTSRM